MATIAENINKEEALSLALKQADRIADLKRPGITEDMRNRANVYMLSRREQLTGEGMPASDAWIEAAWDTRLRVNKELEAKINELRVVVQRSRSIASDLETRALAGEAATPSEKLGITQGELDYLANAQHVEQEIELLANSLAKSVEAERVPGGAYAQQVRSTLEERGLATPIPVETTFIDEVKTTFLDHDIPEEYAQLAIDAADLEDKTPQEREAFYGAILDARADESLEALGFNSWEDSIQAAAMQNNAKVRQAAEVRRLIGKAGASNNAEKRFIVNLAPEQRQHALRGAEELLRQPPVGGDGGAARESIKETATNLRSEMENRQTAKEPSKAKPTVLERASEGWGRLREYGAGLAGYARRLGEASFREVPELSAREAPKPPSESQLRAVLARQVWADTQRETKEHLLDRPGVTTEREALKIMRAGERNAWLVKLVPSAIRDRMGWNVEEKYWQGIQSSYEKLVDKKADGLLDERAKAIQKFASVDIKEPHLLKSSQYRAAVKLIEVDQKLKDLRPLSKDELRTSLQRETSPASAVPREEAPVVKAAETRPEIAIAPSDNAEIQRKEQNRQNAIQVVSELRKAVPVDGFKSGAAKAMSDRIWQQLNEGRITLTLSAKYEGDDLSAARSTHAKAIESNMAQIEAVRNAGIPVDTGKASTAVQKKSELVETEIGAPEQRVSLG